MVTIDDLIQRYPITYSTDPPFTVSPLEDGEAPLEALEQINSLTKSLLGLPPQAQSIPPPPVVGPLTQRAQQANKARDDGNTAFQAKNFPQAVQLYTISASLASSRGLFEASLITRDQLAVALCNRCAAYSAMGQWVNALVDAEATIKLKKTWGRGYFRKGKVLEALGRYEEARQTFTLGLEFEPDNKDIGPALDQLKKHLTISLPEM